MMMMIRTIDRQVRPTTIRTIRTTTIRTTTSSTSTPPLSCGDGWKW